MTARPPGAAAGAGIAAYEGQSAYAPSSNYYNNNNNRAHTPWPATWTRDPCRLPCPSAAPHPATRPSQQRAPPRRQALSRWRLTTPPAGSSRRQLPRQYATAAAAALGGAAAGAGLAPLSPGSRPLSAGGDTASAAGQPAAGGGGSPAPIHAYAGDAPPAYVAGPDSSAVPAAVDAKTGLHSHQTRPSAPGSSTSDRAELHFLHDRLWHALTQPRHSCAAAVLGHFSRVASWRSVVVRVLYTSRYQAGSAVRDTSLVPKSKLPLLLIGQPSLIYLCSAR
ncbi:hypothetical protein V8E36_005264 [Tilletia maclaganii]